MPVGSAGVPEYKRVEKPAVRNPLKPTATTALL